MRSRTHVSALLLFSGFCLGCGNDAVQAPKLLDGEKPAGAEAGENSEATAKASSREYAHPADVLIPGRFRVDIVDIDVPPRTQELTQRLLNAIRENPDLWTTLAKQAGPGEPIPYDPALGLSKGEYKEFLASSEKMEIKKYADAILVITEVRRQVFRLDGKKLLPELTGVDIDLNENVVRTPFGLLTERSDVDAPKESIHGIWKGTEWRFQSVTPDELTDVKFAVGRLGKDGRCLLYYDVNRFDGVKQTAISRTLYFDSPSED